jgi:hypothetical protein
MHETTETALAHLIDAYWRAKDYPRVVSAIEGILWDILEDLEIWGYESPEFERGWRSIRGIDCEKE